MIAPPRPVPTKLPSIVPVRLGLVDEVAVPLLTVRRPEVEAKNALNASGTLVALICQLPPPLPPAAGIDTLALMPSVRDVKFTLSVALPSEPAALFWLVG